MLKKFLEKFEEDLINETIKIWAENQGEMTEQQEDDIVRIYKENLIKRQQQQQHQQQQR